MGTNNNANSPYGDFSSFAAMNRYWEPQDEEGEPILTYTHPLRSETSYSDNPAYNALVGVWNKTRYTNMRSATQVRYNINESFIYQGCLDYPECLIRQMLFAPPSHAQFAGKGDRSKGRFQRNEIESNQWNVRLNVNYAKTLQEKHMLTLSGAAEMEEKKQEQIVWAATGFAADNIDFPSWPWDMVMETYPNGSVTTTRRLALIFAVIIIMICVIS